MIIRFLALVAVLFAASATAPAFADRRFCDPILTFKRDYTADIMGGYYEVGEDPEITSRLRNGVGITAELKIIEPHRTKEFGTGIALLFCDASSGKILRLAFGDNEESDRLSLRTDVFEDGKWSKGTRLLPRTFLSASKADANRVMLRKDAKGQIIVGVSGEVFTFDPGFDIQFLRVQIFCSKSRVRFLDGELIS